MAGVPRVAAGDHATSQVSEDLSLLTRPAWSLLEQTLCMEQTGVRGCGVWEGDLAPGALLQPRAPRRAPAARCNRADRRVPPQPEGTMRLAWSTGTRRSTRMPAFMATVVWASERGKSHRPRAAEFQRAAGGTSKARARLVTFRSPVLGLLSYRQRRVVRRTPRVQAPRTV